MQRKQDTSSKQQLQATEQAREFHVASECALMDLQADMRQMEWLSTLMWVIKREAEEGEPGSSGRIKQLADIGNYLAEDRANILGEECERLESNLERIGGAQ